MSSNLQLLVSRMHTIYSVAELGRYVEIVPFSDNIGIGVEAEFFDRKGKSVYGKVVDVAEDMACGKFPRVSGLVVDTAPQTQARLQYKRMAAGGIQGARK